MKYFLIILLLSVGCSGSPEPEEEKPVKLEYTENTDLEKELDRIDAGGEIIVRKPIKAVPSAPRKTPVQKLMEIHKRIPKTTRTPKNTGCRVVKSRGISHTHHGIIPHPGSPLKPAEKKLFHHAFHYDKKTEKIVCVIAHPGIGQKPYMTDVILTDPKGQTWARLWYDKKGKLGYANYAFYEKGKVILTCRILGADNRVLHVKHHNGYKP